ncbi:alpha/beta fold hydrolase [Proteus myxofaciens]|uniref:Alpha/beta fold family hydrolase n=1 Tax=Proteus myxofaciens ATCC 19692 TaxID=1354337 RepID=A0A198FCM7_9GAMM|nr:alpha/beta fold hydrolase [Proteus myxofaciens]OAT22622.1 alpha/beta fold family hydrolase [Proteus myxofaciens ATCC 19692]
MNIKSERKFKLMLPDTRILSWYESGSEEGEPVVFFTGAGMSGLLSVDDKVLLEKNIRFIIPNRPGLSDSTFDPNKSLASFSHDILFLLNYLDIKKVSVLSFSQGAVFAMAFCFYYHDYVKNLAIISGQDQFSYLKTKEQLISDVVNMQQQANSNPKILSEWISKNITAEWLIDFILKYSNRVDLAIYQSSNFLPIYQSCMADAFKQGNAGYTQDLLMTMQPWGFSPENILTPTQLWYGLKDTSTVHSPDFGELLSQRFPNAKRYTYPDEGGALLWTKTHEILSKIIS